MGVRSRGRLLPVAARFWDKVDRVALSECWEWRGERQRAGYGVFYVGNDRIGAHRMAWELSRDRVVPEGLHVLHSCDNPPCCNPAHLRSGTALDNARDKVERNRSADQRGERAPHSLLTEADVIDIRTLSAFGARGVDLASAFGVSSQAICGVIKRRAWAHVP
jgi:hypothetical protein